MKFLICFSSIIVLMNAKPIMVSFGTNKGPIIPRGQNTTTSPRPYVPENPAPVSEETPDDPPPNVYKPPVPHHYRTKLYSYKPSPNLILGTPIDQKYTPSLQKYDIYKKQQQRNEGVSYTGPHIFERQEYEYEDAQKQRTILQPSVQYVKPHYYSPESRADAGNNQVKYVPQIGIVYSAGVKYYVPQIVYYNEPVGREENSVYDRHDEKHFYYKNRA